MKPIDAEIVRSRIVICKKCAQKNRLHESAESGIYRCASCRAEMPNPFQRHRWLTRWRSVALGAATGALCAGALLLYITSKNGKHDNVQPEQVAAVEGSKDLDWYRKAAEKGDAEAQYRFGAQLYHHGKGMPTNQVKGVEWLEKAATKGNIDAQLELDLIYSRRYSGFEGVPKDEAKAASWVQNAAATGNARAQCSLGFKYLGGKGVPRDAAKAVTWFRRAADQGDISAQHELGTLYALGRGVQKAGLTHQNLRSEMR